MLHAFPPNSNRTPGIPSGGCGFVSKLEPQESGTVALSSWNPGPQRTDPRNIHFGCVKRHEGSAQTIGRRLSWHKESRHFKRDLRALAPFHLLGCIFPAQPKSQGPSTPIQGAIFQPRSGLEPGAGNSPEKRTLKPASSANRPKNRHPAAPCCRRRIPSRCPRLRRPGRRPGPLSSAPPRRSAAVGRSRSPGAPGGRAAGFLVFWGCPPVWGWVQRAKLAVENR